MGRPSKLTPERQTEIIRRLTAGATITATCDAVGVAGETFSNWMKRGKVEFERRAQYGDLEDHMISWSAEYPYFGFFGAATQAQASGLVSAAAHFRAGMLPQDTEYEGTETITETRLRTVKHDNGTVEQLPYEYTKTVRKSSVTTSPGDWRCAADYLARRESDSWSKQQQIAMKHEGEIDININQQLETAAAAFARHINNGVAGIEQTGISEQSDNGRTGSPTLPLADER